MNRWAATGIWLAVATIAHGQNWATVMQAMSTSARSDGRGHVTATTTAKFRTSGPPGLTGAPYSGEERRSEVQILSDGTRVTSPGPPPTKIFRDSQGRTRVERSRGGVALQNSATSLVQINDVVDRIYYLLDPATKTAYRSAKYTLTPARKVSPPFRPPLPISRQVDKRDLQITTESLGIKVIQGVQAEGKKQTTVYPPGYRQNDRPLTDVAEIWISPQLQLTVLQVTTTGTGISTLELANLSLLEPSPDLFRPPADYTVIDKPDTFIFESGTPR